MRFCGSGSSADLWCLRRLAERHHELHSHGKQIQWVHVRHEETAAFAAGAEAHLTGRWRSVRGELWSREPAFDQWAVRLSPQPCSWPLAIAAQIPAGWKSWRYFQRRVRNIYSPGQPLLRTRFSRRPDASRSGNCHANRNLRRGVAVVVIPGDIALRGAVEQGPRLHFSPPEPRCALPMTEPAALAKRS